VDFDGVDDYLEASSSSLANTFDSTYLLAVVSKADNINALSIGGNNKRLIHSFNGGNKLQLVINESGEDKSSSGAGNVSATSGTFYKLQQSLFVAAMNPDKVYIDTVDSGTGTSTSGDPNPSGTGTRIGANKNGVTVNGQYDGNIQEIVVFNTDQSANRTGIETNINDTYTIY